MLLALMHGQAKAADRTPVLTVVVAPVTEQALSRSIAATGNVVAWREMPISTEASGLMVSEINVDEGDRVEKGQVLARLNDSILTAQVAQQTAAIAELEATLANAQSDVRRAQSVSSGVISAQTAEQRETLVKTTTAKIAAARATLDESKARLKQTKVEAPAAGVVSQRSVTLGQVVQTGTEMFRIIQDYRIEVDALVPEADLFDVRAGQQVKVTGPDGGTQRGDVRLISPVVDAKTRLGTVHVSLGQDTALRPGMFARVEIETAAKTAIAVPLKALVWRQSKAGVFVVSDDGVAKFSEVTLGRKTNDMVAVVDGVGKGARIVVEGAGLLNDGDTVQVRVADAQKGSGR
jgi:HlyD family secretion protein